jgi:hypothetical protein
MTVPYPAPLAEQIRGIANEKAKASIKAAKDTVQGIFRGVTPEPGQLDEIKQASYFWAALANVAEGHENPADEVADVASKTTLARINYYRDSSVDEIEQLVASQ